MFAASLCENVYKMSTDRIIAYHTTEYHVAVNMNKLNV